MRWGSQNSCVWVEISNLVFLCTQEIWFTHPCITPSKFGMLLWNSQSVFVRTICSSLLYRDSHGLPWNFSFKPSFGWWDETQISHQDSFSTLESDNSPFPGSLPSHRLQFTVWLFPRVELWNRQKRKGIWVPGCQSEKELPLLLLRLTRYAFYFLCLQINDG